MDCAAKKLNGDCAMLINDLTLIKAIREQRPFLFTYDKDIKTPAVTIVEADDFESRLKVEYAGFPLIICKNAALFFPDGWKIPLRKTELIKTKIFHLMKKFYRIPDEIQITENIKIHLINDWYEKSLPDKGLCSSVIFWFLSSYIYGGALKTDWFSRYILGGSLRVTLCNRRKKFPIKLKLCDELIYLRPAVIKDKMFDFYFYEQNFCGVCEVTKR